MPIHSQGSKHQVTKMLKSLHPCTCEGGRGEVLLSQAWLLPAEGVSFLTGLLNPGAEPQLCNTVCLWCRALTEGCADSQLGFCQSLILFQALLSPPTRSCLRTVDGRELSCGWATSLGDSVQGIGNMLAQNPFLPSLSSPHPAGSKSPSEPAFSFTVPMIDLVPFFEAYCGVHKYQLFLGFHGGRGRYLQQTRVLGPP